MRLLPLAVLASVALAQDEDAPPPWKIVPHEAFEVGARPAAEGVEALIDELTKLDKARGGLSNRSGVGPDLALTDDAFGRLVRLGPAALPAVLAHLDDKRPTKLVFPPHDAAFGAMVRSFELLVPPVRTDEARRIRDAFGKGVATDWLSPGQGLESTGEVRGHAVTVGDCCFVVLGRIVNRPYEAVGSWPTLITAICSPTLDPRVARAVRAAWGGGDPRELLAESLLDDFHTRGDGSNQLQAGAAARLALYFPGNGGPLVARRVQELLADEGGDPALACDILRCALPSDSPALETVARQLIDPATRKDVLVTILYALGSEPDRETARRIRAVFEHVDDVGVAIACLDWLPRDMEGLYPRLERTLRRAEAPGDRGYGNCRRLLEFMIRVDRKRARETCRRHMEGGLPRVLTVLGALFTTRDRELALALAAPLLDETMPVGPMRSMARGANLSDDSRICDYAALVLARTLEEVTFSNPREIEARDREIEAIRGFLEAPRWKTLPYEAFDVEAGAPAENAEALIDELTKIDTARSGLTATSCGGIPLALTDDAFGRLVRLGPAALPAVLAHLDDKRPTKLAFQGWWEAGGVFRVDEVLAPPNRPAETKVIRGAFPGATTDWFADGIDIDKAPLLKDHTVTVGDCCFAILGQIVNRPYAAVRAQPSLLVAVSSPALEPRIAKAMRAVWGRGDPRRILARSLQDDLHSRGGGSANLQTGAAARLMLYFPEQGRPFVVRRFAQLRFDEPGPFPWDLRRDVSKIDREVVRAGCLELLDPKRSADAIWFALGGLGDKPDPEVERRVRIIWDGTRDLEVMVACAAGLPRDDERVVARVMEELRGAEARGADGYAECEGLIRVLLRASPAKALDVCRRYLEEGRARTRNVLGALFEARDKDAALALLPPLLDDTTQLGLTGGAPIPESFRRWDRRVCDYAAAVLARSVEGIKFGNPMLTEDRDREIAAIRGFLDRK